MIISRCYHCSARREYEEDFKIPKKGIDDEKLFKCYDCGHVHALQFMGSDKPRSYYVERGILPSIMIKIKMKGGLKNMVKNDETIEEEETEEVEETSAKPKKEKVAKTPKEKASGKSQFTGKNTACVCSVCGKSKFCRGDIYEKRVKAFGSELLLKRKYVCRDCKKKQKEASKK